MMIRGDDQVSPQQGYLHKSNCDPQVSFDERLFFSSGAMKQLLCGPFLFMALQVDLSMVLWDVPRYI